MRLMLEDDQFILFFSLWLQDKDEVEDENAKRVVKVGSFQESSTGKFKSQDPYPYAIYVTIHDKTNHIAYKIVFEIRRPLPSMAFGLLLENFWSL